MCNFSQHAIWGKLAVPCPHMHCPITPLSPSRGRHFCVISVPVHSHLLCVFAAALLSLSPALARPPGAPAQLARAETHGICMSAHPLLHLPCCAFDWALDSFWFCFWGIWDEILF